MKAGRAFLMIFLLPLLAVAGVAMLVNMGALYSLKQQHGAGVSGQKSDLAALHEATSLAEEMAAVQQRVADRQPLEESYAQLMALAAQAGGDAAAKPQAKPAAAKPAPKPAKR